jgi:translation initiation factor IF-3
MDYGKHRFQQTQKKREAKRRQQQTEEKEIRFRPKIDDNDFSTKIGHAKRFLQEGNKLKAMIMFRGRELAYVDFGKELMDRVAQALEDCATVEFAPKKEGRNMIMILKPLKRAEKSVNAQKEMDRESASKKRARRLARQQSAIEEKEGN